MSITKTGISLIFTALLFFSCKDENSKNQTKTLDKKETTSKTAKKPITEEKKTNRTTDTKVHHYICYTNDKVTSKKVWISFNKANQALQIKYLGQTEGIDLKYVKEDYIKGGTHPTIIKYYNEIYNEKINGIYKLTHSGNWDYISYTRGKDSKEFNFTIDHTANPYGTKPCF